MNTPHRLTAALLLTACTAASAAIHRDDNHQIIPGTQRLTLRPGINLSGWDFPNHNLEHAGLSNATVSHSDLHDADLSNGTLSTVNLTKSDLAGADLQNTNLTNATLRGSNLIDASFLNANTTGSDFTKASIKGADFSAAQSPSSQTNLNTISANGFIGIQVGQFVGHGLTSDQLYSTASYANYNLTGVRFEQDDLGTWNFQQQNLAKAVFGYANLTNADFTGATITAADFDNTNLAPAQLYSTFSYKRHNLNSTNFTNITMNGWNFDGQNLTNANLSSADLDSAILTNATLRRANLSNTILTDANFTGANLVHTNFADANLRGATGFSPVKSTITTNTIFPDGSIHGLALKSGETLVVQNNATPITVDTSATLNAKSTLELNLTANWTSPIHFTPGITPALGGTLNLQFPRPAPITAPTFREPFPLRESFQVFVWNSPLAASDHFDNIVTDNGSSYDLSNLYTTGIVTVIYDSPFRFMLPIKGGPFLPIGIVADASGDTMTAEAAITVPEPISLSTLTIGALFLNTRRRQRVT